MNGTRQTRAELAPTITAALIFLACLAVVSIGATFKVPDNAMFDFPVLSMPAAVASALTFLCAGMLIFWKPRLGYCLGMAGGLIVAVSLARSELELAPGTTWMWLTAGLNAGQAPPFLILRVLAIALAATALCCSAIRILPAGLRVRGRTLCQRTWPAVAVGIAISIIWALRDATPYLIPVCRMGVSADVTVLHVRKSGLHIQQTGVYVFRDQKFYSVVTEHELLHCRVKVQDARGRFPYEQWAGLTRPPAAWTPHSATGRSLLLSWNEERWYVRLNHSRLFMFTGPLPHEIAEFLQRVQQLPVDGRSSWTGRDICLGLRYDPLAELGALTPGEKEALLHLR
jgi:hypothetical protein